MAAPDFAELEWSPEETGGWTAEGNSAFWNLFNKNRAGFKALGFSMTKPCDKWIVAGPDIDEGNRVAFRELVSAVNAEVLQAQIRHQEAFRAQEARDDIRRAQRAIEARVAREQADARIMEARSLRHSKIVADARAAGQACLDKWVTLVARKDTLASLVAMPLLTHAQIRLVYALVAETGAKANGLYARPKAIRDDECVKWSDAAVERAVRYLTGLDEDHAELPNGEGWSGSETGRGHWCVAMLETDTALALRMARTIVGGYREQLSAILSPKEMS